MDDFEQRLLNSHCWVDTGMAVQYCAWCDAKIRLRAGEKILESGSLHCRGNGKAFWNYSNESQESDSYYKAWLP